jgi:hypothetical protein
MQRSETGRDSEVAEIIRRISAKLDELRELDRDLLRAMGFPEMSDPGAGRGSLGTPGVLTDNGNSVGSGGPIPRTKPEQKTR